MSSNNNLADMRTPAPAAIDAAAQRRIYGPTAAEFRDAWYNIAGPAFRQRSGKGRSDKDADRRQGKEPKRPDELEDRSHHTNISRAQRREALAREQMYGIAYDEERAGAGGSAGAGASYIRDDDSDM